MSRGFTLIEVVIALLVLEVAVIGAVGVLGLASSTFGRAEVLERAATETEGLLDSLAHAPAATADSVRRPWGVIAWSLDDSARIGLRATGPRGESLLEVRSVLPAWSASP